MSTHATAEPDPGFGLYVHWPFCKAKCPYCDFNSHVRPEIDEAAWRAALVRELGHYAAEVPSGRRLTSIFFGGGTPSLMSPGTVGAVIDAAAVQFALADGIEITLEANPTSAEAANVAGYRAAGVTRMSIGVQALDDPSLRFLGRQHSVSEALAAVRTARRHVPNVSFDLMTARPNQTPARAVDELYRALAEGPAHVAIYQLTIEPGTAFEGAWRRGELPMPDAETAAEIFDATQATLAEAGLPAYEISNHAVPGAECRHNLTYWRYGDYVGIGPGAHGRLTLDGSKLATRQHSAPEAWLAGVQQHGHATQARTPLSWPARRDELVMMGLRLTEGVARGAFRRELGCDVEAALPADATAELRAEGLLDLDDRRLAATAEGRQRLDAVLGYLLSNAAAAVS